MDKDIAALFGRRMRLVAALARIKDARGLPVRDPEQERRVLEQGADDIGDPALRDYYLRLLNEEMALSREYQEELLGLVPGVFFAPLTDAAKYFNLSRKVLVVTEPGVPSQYPEAILQACPGGSLLTVPGGESGKSMDGVQTILQELLRLGFTRDDAIVAVGGGVIGDMAGFAAACYMRGIDFYNVPTTLLSQVDSSAGGKTAVNLCGVKNIVGAFHQPSGVLIDTGTLGTLSPRLFAEGMAELVKIAAACDASLFGRIERSACLRDDIDGLIRDALAVKMSIVRRDPLENGLRAVLNFGHTVGHAIEAASGGRFYHGECVAMGMLYTSYGEARERLEALLKRLGLPVEDPFDADTLMSFACSDKKRRAEGFRIVEVSRIGDFSFRTVSADTLRAIIVKRKSQ
ncbi:MAG: iron-containing alcohol dehydrogenase [Bacteroidales bacterium]|nr:iron-containing alcohol dehydrogenase [Bacteroidales bacterium]